MVHSSGRRRSSRVSSSVSSQSYASGSVCYLLSSQDAHQLVQFYSLLLRVHRRVSQQQGSRQKIRKNTVRILRNKGSLISGPLFLRVLYGVVGGDKYL